MANFVKPKLGIVLFSGTMILLVAILETKFWAPVTIKRWSQLTWDDFQGIAPPLTQYYAGISSRVYLEFDSTKSVFRAYAGQNNIRSWTKADTLASDNTLVHEQYHFNITELYARKLNRYIQNNPGGGEYLFQLRVAAINSELSNYQDRYDHETDHSIIHDAQRRWEYKIDSLLKLDSAWVVDYYSGAKAYFTKEPTQTQGITNNEIPYRNYISKNYDMVFSLISYQDKFFDNQTIINWSDAYSQTAWNVASSRIDSTSGFIKAIISLNDSTRSAYSIVSRNNEYVYQISAVFANNVSDTSGYYQNAQSFINSVSTLNTDDYWIAKHDQSEPLIIHHVMQPLNNSNNPSGYCINIGKSAQIGFSRGPFYNEHGDLFLAYDFTEHPDSLHWEDLLLIDKDIYTFSPNRNGQIFFLPRNVMPDKDFNINVGYTLQSDSIRQCYEFIYQRH